jgi:hypothetical protein
MVLAFIGATLAATLLWGRLMPAVKRGPSPLPTTWALAVIVVAGSAFQAGKAALAADLLPPSAGSLIDSFPGAVALGVAFLTQTALNHGNRRGVITALAGLGLAAVFLTPFLIKTAILLIGTVILTMVMTFRGRLRVQLVAGLLVLPIVGAIVLGVARNYIRADTVLTNVSEILLSKLVERQAETVFCLDFALKDAFDSDMATNRDKPGYFLAGLVPRAVWQEKPSLSVGAEYSRRYCGVLQPPAGSNRQVHSASITLLGEPALRGGLVGLGLAGLTLTGVLGWVVWAWRRGQNYIPAMAMAVSPWLLDFDQHFAMYLATAVKALLAMMLVCLLLARTRKAVSVYDG